MDAIFPNVQHLAMLADSLCKRGNLFDVRLEKIRANYPNKGLIYAAELAREFRHHVYHGEDEVPEHDEWHIGRVKGESSARIRRFYAVARLILILIQAMTWLSIPESTHEIEFGQDEDGEPLMVAPHALLSKLHLVPAIAV